ncbi:hypothetical protein BRC60_04260 [Halobacteriales archaeon QH_1_68_42]|nr:MAG: hypothetical protein BRC60_04260 [Halobacteriales archaeon QH_1_68_42]
MGPRRRAQRGHLCGPVGAVSGGASVTAVERQPAFAPGERVRVVTVDVGPYKRPPEYAEDAVGTVKGVHGTYATTADGEESYLYSVRFDGKRLWDDPDANRSVRVDLWEGCLAGVDG